MKKYLIFTIAMVFTTSMSAQIYVSASSGYAMGSAGVKFGDKTTINGIENTYGSYGEGLNAQFRMGYNFNKTFGLELGLGYLHGANQTIKSVVGIPGQPNIDLFARGRAYGFSSSVVYNFTNHLYGRFGALIKVGGKTELVGSIESLSLPAGAIPGVPIATNLAIDFIQDYKGRLPLGFIGAMGYKHKIGKNLNIFAELEYMGISVTRDTSEIVEFNASLQEVPGSTLSIDQVRSILEAGGSSLAGIFNKDIEYVDELPLGNTDSKKQLSQTVPYSSFGINFGITYTFSKKK
jgi:long-subunit fatty acid transport protein